MPDNTEVEAPRLYAFLNVVYYLWSTLFGLAVALDIGTGIDNFLHAPIGIKDNPPDPGALVDLARDLIFPLAIGWLVLKLFRWFAKEMGAKFVAGAVAWLIGVSFLASAMLSYDVPTAVSRASLFARALTPIEVDEAQLFQQTKSALLRGGSIGCDALEFFDSLQGSF
jgi:hypothetical protein